MLNNVKKRSFAAALTGLVLAAGAHAQSPSHEDMVLGAAERKQVIDTLIKEVDARYVVPEVASNIASTLRAREKHGDYDAITSAQQLARTLSEQLYQISHDKHMGVRYSARALVPDGGAPTAGQQAAELAQLKARNFGVERVERLPGNIGYLDLRNFMAADRAGPAIAAAMTLLQNTDALILDLRQNGGGEPSGVALLASYFFDKRTHLTDYQERGAGTAEQSWSVEHLAGPKYGAARPLFILTSARTFSAAEEFCYDLQVLKRATIVGETTGGGAHPGDVYQLADHFKMFIPTGRSVNPVTKSDWDGVGVTPDIGIKQEQALARAQAAALNGLMASAGDAGTKAELQQRLQELAAGQP